MNSNAVAVDSKACHPSWHVEEVFGPLEWHAASYCVEVVRFRQRLLGDGPSKVAGRRGRGAMPSVGSDQEPKLHR